MTTTLDPNSSSTKRPRRSWVVPLLLVYIVLAGAFLRFNGTNIEKGTGLFWGEYQYLHPDERFLVWVGSDINPVHSLSEYFDTVNSSLNPNNRGHGFYVYGTFPMFITRYLVELIFGHSGFDVMTQVGRTLSALMDLFTVCLVYLVGERLYGRRVGVLAAAFSAATVLQIQQSHFFTMDTFMVAFAFLAFYFAVLVLMDTRSQEFSVHALEPASEPATSEGTLEAPQAAPQAPGFLDTISGFFRHPLFVPCLGFGIALGMAVASKLDAVPMAVALPAAMLIHLAMLPREKRSDYAFWAAVYLFIAAVISLLVFRLVQPYAFSGPGFFGLKPNPQFVANIRELMAQGGKDVDFPPAMQWARRSRLFSLQNIVMWGLGLPFGILAWTGFLWMAWRMLRGWLSKTKDWLPHALLWGWTAMFFIYQSMRLNPTMRYELMIYPMLAIFAAWAVIALYDLKPQSKKVRESEFHPPADETLPPPDIDEPRSPRWPKVAAVLIGGAVLLYTYAYAYGFSNIYARPITRIAASRWIYQNIPGPVTLPVQTDQGVVNQPLTVPYGQTISPGLPLTINFRPNVSGTLNQVLLPRVAEQQGNHQTRSLTLTVTPSIQDNNPPASASSTGDLTPAKDSLGKSLTFYLDRPVILDPSQTYNLKVALQGEQSSQSIGTLGDTTLYIEPNNADASTNPAKIPVPQSAIAVDPNGTYAAQFLSTLDGTLTQLHIYLPAGQANAGMPATIDVSALSGGQISETSHSILSGQVDPDGRGYLLSLDTPIAVKAGQNYLLNLQTPPPGGSITLSGLGVANEGEWDDGLPLRMDNYDGFGGIYPQDLNFNMYWDDNAQKLDRFTRILDQSDYLVISSNRQWGSLPRLPERFPLVTAYYRNLLGCPPEQDIVDCYRVAAPGMFKGNLGYDLIQTFTSEPSIGPLHLNDQFAEEAFTVYDHPKVLIFKKNENYNPDKVRSILSMVDFSKVARIPPLQAPPRPADLMLPADRLAQQEQGGTWSELFNVNALQNRFEVVGVVLWYLSVFLLGLIIYPLLRLALPGLADRGYPLARTAGLLVLSYLVWLAGSYRIPFTRPTIAVVIVLMALLGALLAYWQRDELRKELRGRGRYFLIVEGLFLAFFLADLYIRYNNPDLWHPWKGGEKPMDFSYFNAVLKSTTFPPYDPWFAGGYMNYYYYGFVLVGVLVKFLGILPEFAYNLILPTIFSLIAMGAFSIVWNLASARGGVQAESEGTPESPSPAPYIPALAGSFGMAVLGNLGTVRMIYQGYQKLVAPNGEIEGASLINHLVWAWRGLMMSLHGFITLNAVHMPYGIGDWYWIPSRAIPASGEVEPITEFPFFTVLYGDPHAHLFALPITLLALGIIIAIVLGRARWKNPGGGIAWFLLAGLAIGALRPTNTWDLPSYLALGIIAIGYAVWSYYRPSPALARIPVQVQKIISALGGILALVGLSFLLFQPYADWYALGYTKIDLWHGTHTPLTSYFVHWGVFLFLIVSWMVWETRDWLAKTPVSALRKLSRYLVLIYCLAILLIGAIIMLQFGLKVNITWLVLPLAAWAAVLILRPGQSDAKRIVLFLIGTSLVLTLMVEVVVLRGDIARMNTVFKFYLQVWTMFSVSAAASLGWLLDALPEWQPGWRRAWAVALTLLVAGALLFTMTASLAKMQDRMSERAPHTLDGMAFMPTSSYTESWGSMDLNQDYKAIRWLQDNVKGSPVIVEANLRDLYRWGSRDTIYTGLPGVAGWEWHQQQQRAVVPGSWVTDRIMEIDNFYNTTDWQQAADFLHKYNVRYVIVGQQERGHYPGPGLEKFDAAKGHLWNEVYRQGDTVIYEVIPQ